MRIARFGMWCVSVAGFPAAAAAAYAAYGRGLTPYPGISFPYPTGNFLPLIPLPAAATTTAHYPPHPMHL